MTTLQLAPLIKMGREEARERWREYRDARKVSEPAHGDDVLESAFKHLAQGKQILDLDKAIQYGGHDEETMLPRFAIARADAHWCGFKWGHGRAIFTTHRDGWNRYDFDERLVRVEGFPRDVLPLPEELTTGPQEHLEGHLRSARYDNHQAMLPSIPPALRPRAKLHNYHVLWEAAWEKAPPEDPFLLRRIMRSRLFVVLAHWDLSELEQSLLRAMRVGEM